MRRNRSFREVSSKLANSSRKQPGGREDGDHAVQPIPLRPASVGTFDRRCWSVRRKRAKPCLGHMILPSASGSTREACSSLCSYVTFGIESRWTWAATAGLSRAPLEVWCNTLGRRNGLL
jgi:hypothetical protein